MPKCHYGKARCIRGAQTAWAGGLRWNNDNALHSKSTDVPFNTRFQSDRTPFLHRVNKTCTHRLSRHTPFVYMCILYRKRKWAIQNATSTLSDKRGRHRRVLKKKNNLGQVVYMASVLAELEKFNPPWPVQHECTNVPIFQVCLSTTAFCWTIWLQDILQCYISKATFHLGDNSTRKAINKRKQPKSRKPSLSAHD